MTDDRIFKLRPVGHIRRAEASNYLEILDQYRPALKLLRYFSHVTVVWWAEQQDTDINRSILQAQPFYAPSVVAGVFACRTTYRPNPLGMAVCAIMDINEEMGMVYIDGALEAPDGVPLVDLKAYHPAYDCALHAQVPEWLSNGHTPAPPGSAVPHATAPGTAALDPAGEM